MASGRMLQRKISQSHDVAKLIETVCEEMGLEHGPFAGLLFTWSIAHQDREGRMHGDPRLVKAAVFPLIDAITAKHIESYLASMQRLGLVNWYEVEGKRYLQFPTFDANQPGIRKEREPESVIPEPSKGVAVNRGALPSNCRQTADKLPAEVEEKGKEVEGKRTIPDSPAAPRDEFDFEAVYARYPRKEGRKKGLQRFKSQITTRLKYDALIKAVENYAAVASPGYEKHFDTFMGCWEDYVNADLLAPRKPSRPGNTPPTAHYEVGGDVTKEFT